MIKKTIKTFMASHILVLQIMYMAWRVFSRSHTKNSYSNRFHLPYAILNDFGIALAKVNIALFFILPLSSGPSKDTCTSRKLHGKMKVDSI